MPAFWEVVAEEFWAGLIDMTPDALPVINAPGTLEGLVIAAGFSGHGFGLGPAIGRILADLVLGRTPGLPIEAFRLARFAAWNAAPQPVTLHG